MNRMKPLAARILPRAALIFVLVNTALVSFIPPIQASTEIQKNPSSYSGKWFLPQNAYQSDNQYTFTSTKGAVMIYYDYGFQNVIPSDATIDEVLVGLEHYETTSSYAIDVRLSWDGGNTWSDYARVSSTEEVLDWLNATGLTDWTPEKLSDENFRVKLQYRVESGGACYPNNMYFVATQDLSALGKEREALLEMEKWDVYNPEQILQLLEKGTPLYALSWNETHGYFLSEDSLITKVDVHEGKWRLYDIYSGELDICYYDPAKGQKEELKWRSHTELTSEHKVFYSLDQKEWILGTAEELYSLWGAGNPIYINHLWFNYTLRPFPVTEISVREYSGKTYNVWLKGDTKTKERFLFKKGKTLSPEEYQALQSLKAYGVPIGKLPPFLVVSQKIPWTTYLDWLPVKVTYSEEGGPEYEETDCEWIGVNNTLAGEVTLFRSNWEDLNDTEGLSHYLFSTNNTGSWANDTWSSSWVDTVWAEAEKTLNTTPEVTVAFRFYVNSSAGSEYASTICFFTVEEAVTSDRFMIGIYYGVAGGFILGVLGLIVVVRYDSEDEEGDEGSWWND